MYTRASAVHVGERQLGRGEGGGERRLGARWGAGSGGRGRAAEAVAHRARRGRTSLAAAGSDAFCFFVGGLAAGDSRFFGVEPLAF